MGIGDIPFQIETIYIYLFSWFFLFFSSSIKYFFFQRRNLLVVNTYSNHKKKNKRKTKCFCRLLNERKIDFFTECLLNSGKPEVALVAYCYGGELGSKTSVTAFLSFWSDMAVVEGWIVSCSQSHRWWSRWATKLEMPFLNLKWTPSFELTGRNFCKTSSMEVLFCVGFVFHIFFFWFKGRTCIYTWGIKK